MKLRSSSANWPSCCLSSFLTSAGLSILDSRDRSSSSMPIVLLQPFRHSKWPGFHEVIGSPNQKGYAPFWFSSWCHLTSKLLSRLEETVSGPLVPQKARDISAL